MKTRRLLVATCGALTLLGLAATSHAQSAPAGSQAAAARARSRVEQTTPSFAPEALNGAFAGRRSLQWNGDGRWGLKLDFDQPMSRDVQWKDVEAGASFRVTPRLRLGASVGLGEQAIPPRRVTPDDKPQPRVRFETTFRF